VLIAATATFGAMTLADSQAGRDAAAGIAEVSLPVTTVATMVVLDQAGAPASMAIVVLSPDGRGGNVIPVPVSAADAVFNLALEVEDVLPLAETWELFGAEEFALQSSEVLGLASDFVEVVEADRLGELLGVFGSIELDVPDLSADVARVTGLAPGVRVVLEPEEVARLLSTSSPQIPNREFVPLHSAIWEALAGRVGPGIVTASGDRAVLESLEVVLAQLVAGEVGVRAPTFSVPEARANPRQVDAVILDVAELIVIFGQIAPANVAAPNPSFIFRVESTFSEQQLAPYGVNNADIARELVQILLFLQSNVISVYTSDEGAPPTTVGLVARDAAIETLAQNWSLVFGAIDLVPTAEVIAQVDVTVILGEDYLEFRQQRLEQDSS